MGKKKEKEVSYINQRKPFFNFVKKIGRFFIKKPEIINLNEEPLADRAIYISNHGINGIGGLFANELYFPKFFVILGQYEMFSNFRERWFYLYELHYKMRQGESVIVSFLKATFVALFSRLCYKGAQVIPTFNDARSIYTFKKCFEVFDENRSIIIYPENLNDLYNNVFREFHSGFVSIAELYHKKKGIDLPIYPVYYSHQLNVIVIGKPSNAIPLLKQGKSREEVASYFKNELNQLFVDHVEPRVKAKLEYLSKKVNKYAAKRKNFKHY